MFKFRAVLFLALLLPLILGAGEVFEDAPPEAPPAAAPPAAAKSQQPNDPWEDAPKPAALKPRGRILEVKTARGVVAGRPLGVSRVFSPEVNPIYVWFRFAGAPPGSRFVAKWHYLGSKPPHAMGQAEVENRPGTDWGQFNYELAPGKKWPTGRYRVDLYLQGKKAAVVIFQVAPAQPTAQRAQAPAPRRASRQAAASAAMASEQADILRRRQAKLDFTQALDEFNAGRYQKAVQLFERYLAVFPADGQARKYLAQAREQVVASQSGTLKVTSTPQAQVYLDGRPLGRTPLIKAGLPVGRYKLEARQGDLGQSHDLKIQPRTTTTVEFDLRQRLELAPAQPPGEVFVHPELGFRLRVPPGWKLDRSSKKADLRIRPPQGEGFIQVDFKKGVKRYTPLVFSQKWEKAALGPDKLFYAKFSGRELSLNGLPAYEGVYQGKGIRTKVLFIKGPGDFALLSGIFLEPDYAGHQATFDLVAQSYRFP